MSRHEFDGDKLGHDVARLAAADKDSPPSAQPSLMDAVRDFAPFIETRTRLNWGDRKIAAVLTAAGYPIDAATLRSYRKRLRDEGLLPPLEGKGSDSPVPVLAPKSAGPTPAPSALPIPATEAPQAGVDADHSTMPPDPPNRDGTASRAPPEPIPLAIPANTRRFSIDPTKRPLDRA